MTVQGLGLSDKARAVLTGLGDQERNQRPHYLNIIKEYLSSRHRANKSRDFDARVAAAWEPKNSLGHIRTAVKDPTQFKFQQVLLTLQDEDGMPAQRTAHIYRCGLYFLIVAPINDQDASGRILDILDLEEFSKFAQISEDDREKCKKNLPSLLKNLRLKESQYLFFILIAVGTAAICIPTILGVYNPGVWRAADMARFGAVTSIAALWGFIGQRNEVKRLFATLELESTPLTDEPSVPASQADVVEKLKLFNEASVLANRLPATVSAITGTAGALFWAFGDWVIGWMHEKLYYVVGLTATCLLV